MQSWLGFHHHPSSLIPGHWRLLTSQIWLSCSWMLAGMWTSAFSTRVWRWFKKKKNPIRFQSSDQKPSDSVVLADITSTKLAMGLSLQPIKFQICWCTMMSEFFCPLIEQIYQKTSTHNNTFNNQHPSRVWCYWLFFFSISNHSRWGLWHSCFLFYSHFVSYSTILWP